MKCPFSDLGSCANKCKGMCKGIYKWMCKGMKGQILLYMSFGFLHANHQIPSTSEMNLAIYG